MFGKIVISNAKCCSQGSRDAHPARSVIKMEFDNI